MISLSVHTVVLDIEGTTGSAGHVHDVLFPYARERFAGWFADRRSAAGRSAVPDALEAVRADAGDPALTEADAVALLQRWTDDDVKMPSLKTVQAAIWAAGYADATLTGHVYPEVPRAIATWREHGIGVHIYSSGSVDAQRNWFTYSNHGDLSGLLCGYHDLTTAGGKRSATSYRKITAAIGTAPRHTVFLSDVAAELDAAAEAGWQTVGVRRDDDPRDPDVPGHRTVAALDQLQPTAPAPGPAAPG